MDSDLARIEVQLLWWGDITGRLILIRTMNRRDAGFCEIWWSGPVSRGEVAATEFLLHEVQWQQLQAGLPIEHFDLPIPLYRLSDEDDEDDRAAIAGALRRPDFHPLLSLRTLTENSVVQAVDQPLLGTHELSQLFRTTPAFAPESFSTEAPPPRAEYEVILSDVRGVMIGDDNIQINRFEITVPDADFTVEKVLARPNVKRAIAELTMNPGDETRRSALIDALTRPGWFVSWSPARLLVTESGTMKTAGFLASLLGFNVGVMVGDHNRQTNHFTYVTSSLPDAQSLLAGNRELAEAVAGLMVPEDGTSDTSALLNVVNDAIRDLPVDFENGRLHSLVLPPYPSPSLTRVDGAMVGEGNLQQYDVSVEVAVDPDVPVIYPFEDPSDLPFDPTPPDDLETGHLSDPHALDRWNRLVSDDGPWDPPQPPPPPEDPGEFPGPRGPSLF
jgi:hypothetical protein